MITALLTATGAGAYLGSAVVARHRAQAVADLAALAGAARVTSGADAACAGAAPPPPSPGTRRRRSPLAAR
ncbi:pilus assembly protein TadG-related protein [Mycobacterium colombiense]|nr:pilus assembly protein TadG-related protein [Mycobacterium colombiense]